MFLARRNSALEPAELVRNTLSGAMEHAHALPGFTHLFAAAPSLVAKFFLPAASFSWRARHVFPRAPLDESSPRRRSGWTIVHLQWLHAQLPDVVEQHRRPGVDAVGGNARAERVETRRSCRAGRSAGWGDTNAFRRSGNDSSHLG